ncbi:hypothetical protein OG564_08485 [Streptomyces sp. NBC_01280]|uniref:hypothetical protein n=1 Tax=Streptomyces sp. NBC_01280 TaxID=2903810 RepID=UPI002E313687|nr:hypothetical protein [Streptomyces sp. NBC_01280]
MKLGARPEEYLQSFYGAMDDAIKGGGESDRVLTAWDLTAPAGPYAFDLPADLAHGVRNVDGRPVITPTDADTALIAPRRHRVPAPYGTWRRPRLAAGPYGTPSAAFSPSEPRVAGLHHLRSYVLHRTAA